MESKIVYLFIMLIVFFSYMDIKYRTIHNVVVLPAIIVGMLLTNHIWPVVWIAVLGALLFKGKIWRGGDVKLIMMYASFLGYLAFPIFLLSWVGILIYCATRENIDPIPCAPFMAIGSLPFLIKILATQ